MAATAKQGTLQPREQKLRQLNDRISVEAYDGPKLAVRSRLCVASRGRRACGRILKTSLLSILSVLW